MTSGSATDRVFLTVITYPEGMSHNDVAELLADGGGLDAPSLRMILKQTPPCIAGRYDRGSALGALRALIKAGGDGFAPTMADIEALGPTLKIKDLRLGAGGLEADLWRGPSATINPDAIQIIVRAHLSEKILKPRSGVTGTSILTSYTRPGASSVAIGWGMGGAYGLALGLYAGGGFSPEAREERTVVLSHKLDIHTADDRVFQIDGDKFAYLILGDQRGYSDNENTDKMCELLAHLSPNAVVDPYFSYWHPPPGHQRLRLLQMKINKDDPAFAFYSRWAALMYRHVMRG
ncbi:MAG: hypothetical protein JSV91_06515 [Phycisphaerales bacterium]|nr:MAG: hypothetical protein JSV91_06515 [Phycisphaerales bacterium]